MERIGKLWKLDSEERVLQPRGNSLLAIYCQVNLGPAGLLVDLEVSFQRHWGGADSHCSVRPCSKKMEISLSVFKTILISQSS